MTTYYTHNDSTGIPIAGSRGVSSLFRTEFEAIEDGFETVNTEMTTKAPLASPPLTGIPTAPTAAPGTNTTQVATTEFVAASFAPLDSPALTGVPTAPTAALGTNTNQVATMAALIAQAFTSALPAQPGGTITYQLTSTAGVAGWALSSPGSSLYLANNYGAF